MGKNYLFILSMILCINLLNAQTKNRKPNKPKVVHRNLDAFNNAARKVDKKYAKDRQFDVSKMTAGKVNLSQTDYDKFVKEYDAKTFGKLGYDINRDNAEYYYLRTGKKIKTNNKVKPIKELNFKK
jgi:hypothetical protein